MLTDASFCEKTNKRRHSMISKKSKYVEVDSNEDEDGGSDSDDICEC